jgi:hypothetical protein
VSERDWQRELEDFLAVRFLALCRARDQPVPPSGLRINPPLAAYEAKYFLLGLEAGLFDPDADGDVQSPLLPSPSIENTKQTGCQIFWHHPPPSRLFREGICQLATAAALILDRGWLVRHIELEPTVENQGSTAGRADILVKSIAGELLACVEVKRSAQELAKLKNDFYQCCKRGKHPEDNCGFPQNHANYEFCAFYKPLYFWGVAPGEDTCFKMDYHDEGIIHLTELPSLPARSIVEI